MTSNPITLRTVGTGILVVGIIVILIAAFQAYGQYNVLRSWTPLSAQFLRTDVRNEKINITIQTGRADRYIVTWTFRFNIGGVWHEATADPGTHGTYSQMIAWMRRFHPGQQVLIRYNPSNPDEISAAGYDWITFSRAAWVAAWGIGIIIVGFVLRRFSNPAVASEGP
jgi:Protein of unknown function (DUF3592)